MRLLIAMILIPIWPVMCCWFYHIGPEWFCYGNNLPWLLSCITCWAFLWIVAGYECGQFDVPEQKPINPPQRTPSSEDSR